MASLGGFGGILPVRLTPDPTTGWAASQHSRAAADLVALKRSAPLAVVTFTSSASGNPLTVHSCWTMIDVGAASEFAPAIFRTGTGVITVRFLSQFLDEYDIGAPFDIRHAKVTGHGSTCIKANVDLISPNQVRVRLFDSSGSPVDGKVTLKVS